MSDLDHTMGTDLSLGPTGDLRCADGSDAIRERVLRRLLTNRGDYVWWPDYGGGLPGFVGQSASQPLLEAVIRAQMLLEGSVARRPLASVSVDGNEDGTVTASIQFADRDAQTVQQANVVIGGM